MCEPRGRNCASYPTAPTSLSRVRARLHASDERLLIYPLLCRPDAASSRWQAGSLLSRCARVAYLSSCILYVSIFTKSTSSYTMAPHAGAATLWSERQARPGLCRASALALRRPCASLGGSPVCYQHTFNLTPLLVAVVVILVQPLCAVAVPRHGDNPAPRQGGHALSPLWLVATHPHPGALRPVGRMVLSSTRLLCTQLVGEAVSATQPIGPGCCRQGGRCRWGPLSFLPCTALSIGS